MVLLFIFDSNVADINNMQIPWKHEKPLKILEEYFRSKF